MSKPKFLNIFLRIKKSLRNNKQQPKTVKYRTIGKIFYINNDNFIMIFANSKTYHLYSKCNLFYIIK